MLRATLVTLMAAAAVRAQLNMGIFGNGIISGANVPPGLDLASFLQQGGSIPGVGGAPAASGGSAPAPSNAGGSSTGGGGDGGCASGQDDCLTGSFSGAVCGAQSSLPDIGSLGLPGTEGLSGNLMDQFGEIDFCQRREEPKEETDLGWNDFDAFLKDPQAAVKAGVEKAAQDACQSQIDDEKAKCERQKKIVCKVLDTEQTPDQLINTFIQEGCTEQKQKIAADACNQVTDAIFSGKGMAGSFDSASLQSQITDTATEVAATELICSADLDTLKNLGSADGIGNLASAAQGAGAASQAASALGGSGGGSPLSIFKNPLGRRLRRRV